MKICKDCGLEKELKEFHSEKRNKDGLLGKCKNCVKEDRKKWFDVDVRKATMKKYRDSHKEELRIKNLEYIENNKEKEKIRRKKYSDDNKENIKNYAKLNKEKRNNRDRNREHEKMKNPEYRLTVNIRTAIKRSFRLNKQIKGLKSLDIIGFSTFEDFKQYIENKFESWMSWENYGKYNGEFNYGWDIDHIIPISSINLSEDLIKLNHHTNLRPLCSKINRDLKKAKLEFIL